MIESVVRTALSLVNQGYIFGADGQICTPAFREQQAAQYPEWHNNIMILGAKWDGKPVWDCAQLTRRVAKAGGVKLVSGATSQWRKTDWAKKGTIDTLPPGETVLVYRQGGGLMQHTGVALGDGRFVHAKGTDAGVVLDDYRKYAWTHWGLPRWEAEDMVNDEILYWATVTAHSGSTVNLRKEPGGDLLNRVPVGTLVNVLAEAGAGWAKVEAGNDVGYMQTAFLLKDGAQGSEDSNQTAPATKFEEKVIELLEGIYGVLKGDAKG